MLWFEGSLVALDVGEQSLLHTLLLPGVAPLRTLGEDVFGTSVADVFWVGGQLLVEDFGARRE